jgi:hypothetical protein
MVLLKTMELQEQLLVLIEGGHMGQRESARLLTVFEAQARTGRRVSSWRKDILERKIPYVKLGRSVRIPVEVVDKIIAQGWREPVKGAQHE